MQLLHPICLVSIHICTQKCFLRLFTEFYFTFFFKLEYVEIVFKYIILNIIIIFTFYYWILFIYSTLLYFFYISYSYIFHVIQQKLNKRWRKIMHAHYLFIRSSDSFISVMINNKFTLNYFICSDLFKC